MSAGMLRCVMSSRVHLHAVTAQQAKALIFVLWTVTAQ